MARAAAVLGGLAALALALGAFGFVLWATEEGSVLQGVGKATVLALAVSGVAAASGGLVVALRGIAWQAWLLHGLAVVLAVASYLLAVGIAETA